MTSECGESLQFLVADGEESFATSVADSLEAVHDAVTAEAISSGREVIEQGAENGADAVIVGDTLRTPAKTIERLTNGFDRPVVLLTDSATREPIPAAIEAGVTDVLPRVTAESQYELLAERFSSEHGTNGDSAGTNGDTDDSTSDAERAYRTVFENVNDGLVVHDAETGAIIDVNERFCEMNGYEREELVGEDIGIVTAPAEEYSYEAAHEKIKAARTEGPQLFEWRNQRRNGETFPVEVNLSIVRLHGEQRVLASVRDISERKQREREYEQIFNGVQDGLQIMDPDTLETIDVNEAYLDMFGYDSVEDIRDVGVEGMSLTEEGFTFEQGREIHQRVQETGEPEIVEWHAETADGEDIWLELKVTPVVIGGEELNIVVHRDITERKHREQRLEVFNRILRHNLRNQVDVIKSHAKVLADRTDSYDATQINTAADRLAAIGERARKIDQFMSREHNETTVDLSERVETKLDSIDFPNRDVTVTRDLPDRSTIVTDREVIDVVLESALDNAVRYAESSVEVTVASASAGYEISIADDGPGIPSEELRPLEAGTETELQHGRGLGLWQLKWGVQKLNGRLSFDINQGTTVRITVPDLQADERRQ